MMQRNVTSDDHHACYLGISGYDLVRYCAVNEVMY